MRQKHGGWMDSKLSLLDTNGSDTSSRASRSQRHDKPAAKSARELGSFCWRMIALLYLVLAAAALVVANAPATLFPGTEGSALNWLALVSGLVAAGLLSLPAHQPNRNLLVVPALLAAGLIALASFFSGGWGSPLPALYFPLIVLCVVCLPPRLAAPSVGLTLTASLSPQLYAPDASLLVRQLLILVPVYILLAFVARYAAIHWARSEYEGEFRKMRKLKDRIRREVYMDHLTGVSNRAHFEERLEEELKRVRRLGGSAVLMFIDVDDFKQVNDSYGHRTGDEVLKLVARTLRSNARQIDEVARYGGDEFVVLMPGTSPEGARNFFERIRKEIAGRSRQTFGFPITFSAGAVKFSPETGNSARLLDAADEAMYTAKRRGKDRLLTATTLGAPQNGVKDAR